MAGHHHDDHSAVQKPVAFTVPFILAAVTLVIMLLFLSLCDPKPHDAHNGHHGTENAAHAKFEGEVHNPNSGGADAPVKGDHATTTTQDSATTDAAAPADEHGGGNGHH